MGVCKPMNSVRLCVLSTYTLCMKSTRKTMKMEMNMKIFGQKTTGLSHIFRNWQSESVCFFNILKCCQVLMARVRWPAILRSREILDDGAGVKGVCVKRWLGLASLQPMMHLLWIESVHSYGYGSPFSDKSLLLVQV